jgi:hypothetical protein
LASGKQNEKQNPQLQKPKREKDPKARYPKITEISLPQITKKLYAYPWSPIESKSMVNKLEIDQNK